MQIGKLVEIIELAFIFCGEESPTELKISNIWNYAKEEASIISPDSLSRDKFDELLSSQVEAGNIELLPNGNYKINPQKKEELMKKHCPKSSP